VPAAVKIRVEEWILAAELDIAKLGGKPGCRYSLTCRNPGLVVVFCSLPCRDAVILNL
jgi:hypothetical protein